jgi:hypothetical protein
MSRPTHRAPNAGFVLLSHKAKCVGWNRTLSARSSDARPAVRLKATNDASRARFRTELHSVTDLEDGLRNNRSVPRPEASASGNACVLLLQSPHGFFVGILARMGEYLVDLALKLCW